MKKDNMWKLNKRSRCLSIKRPDIRKGPGWYDVDLDKCSTSAGVLDWIMQVEGKAWSTDHILAEFVREIRRVLSPQSTLCTNGQEQGPIDIKKLLKGEKNKLNMDS